MRGDDIATAGVLEGADRIHVDIAVGRGDITGTAEQDIAGARAVGGHLNVAVLAGDVAAGHGDVLGRCDHGHRVAGYGGVRVLDQDAGLRGDVEGIVCVGLTAADGHVARLRDDDDVAAAEGRGHDIAVRTARADDHAVVRLNGDIAIGEHAAAAAEGDGVRIIAANSGAARVEVDFAANLVAPRRTDAGCIRLRERSVREHIDILVSEHAAAALGDVVRAADVALGDLVTDVDILCADGCAGVCRTHVAVNEDIVARTEALHIGAEPDVVIEVQSRGQAGVAGDDQVCEGVGANGEASRAAVVVRDPVAVDGQATDGGLGIDPLCGGNALDDHVRSTQQHAAVGRDVAAHSDGAAAVGVGIGDTEQLMVGDIVLEVEIGGDIDVSARPDRIQGRRCADGDILRGVDDQRRSVVVVVAAVRAVDGAASTDGDGKAAGIRGGDIPALDRDGATGADEHISGRAVCLGLARLDEHIALPVRGSTVDISGGRPGTEVCQVGIGADDQLAGGRHALIDLDTVCGEQCDTDIVIVLASGRNIVGRGHITE